MNFSIKYVSFCVTLLATIVLVYADDDSFAFPDELIVETKSRFSGNPYANGYNSGYNNNQYQGPSRRPFQNNYHGYNNYGDRYDNTNKFSGHNGFGGINTQYPSGFGGHPVYNQQARPWQGPNNGIINKYPSNIYNNGNDGGSFANAESNAQASNGFANSNSKANAQGWNNPSNYYPGGASSASSAASATSGIVNGYPVAASSAAAAAASGGSNSVGLSSALATSSAIGGNYNGGFNNLSPWNFRSRIGGNEEEEQQKVDEKIKDNKSDEKNKDSIVFRE
ncbi:hypothetical protein HCN44_005642 [Aphidius gifuensis]|uniref:Uncharacterized protein n=1 Tax=Aphidius gifuensis TaxID=684658 RepID=A0A834Y126_APHGI|nr:GATA zinc finger domain-containing protein 14-like [Aphidius gifuensis]KAF7997365.1 hypothetical protein HCN44_005642 [Aphidius gifuensis]